MVDEKGTARAAILQAGLACGVLDLTAAIVTSHAYGSGPQRLLQYVASGMLGPAAFTGGWGTAAVGAACHFLIAFTAAAVFYLASTRLPVLTRRPVLSGLAYGFAVYLVMYWIVRPLSLIPQRPFAWFPTCLAIATHLVCVGLPISLAVYRVRRRR